MRDILARIAIAAALGCAGGSACAMNANHQTNCRVIDGGKLPADSGGADALCQALTAAVEAKAPGQGYHVEVRVLGSSRLAATVTSKDGQKIAEQQLASMDKPLTAGSFKRFAAALAAELVKASAEKS
jgi:hypothetical protein